MSGRDILLNLGFRRDAALLARMVDGVLLGAQPVVVAVMLWAAVGGNPQPFSLWCAIILLAIFTVRRLLLGPVTRRLYAEAYRGGLRLRRAILAQLVGMPLGAFRAIEGGKLIQAMSEDVLWLENHAAYTRPDIAANAAALGLCLLGAVLAWPIAGIVAITSMVVGFAVLAAAHRMLAKGLERRARSLADASLAMQEHAEGVSVLRAFAEGDDEGGADFARNVARLRDGAWRGIRQLTPLAILFRMVIELSGALALVVSILTFGDAPLSDAVWLAAGAGLVASATIPARNFASLTAMLVLARIGQRNIDAIVGVPLLHAGDAGRPDALGVRYENVSFTHRGRGTPALNGITFEAKPGEMVALIGSNGSGKTTCLQLLMRFWEPDGGTISIGGRDIRDIGDKTLASLIAPVFQEALLFDQTIADNIRVGRPFASDADVEAAAKAASIHEAILGFPLGYNTMVGALGARLSGGERQRICIARAVLKDAPIVILDEAASALDPESEEAIQRAVSALAAGRTLFVIAHNLPSIAAATRIILLDAGHIAASGTHETLWENSPAYRQLWNRSTAAKNWHMAGRP